MKETDLYPTVKEYFSELGYEVYSEVLNNHVPNGVAYADVVLKYENIVTVMELKKSLSLDLLEQAIRWKNVAHYVYVGVPEPKNGINDFAARILSEYGIGLLTINIENNRAYERIKGKLCRKICCDWSKYLTEEHKYNVGGDTAGGWITPYSSTISQLQHCLKHMGEMTVDEILNMATVHWMHPKQGIYNALKNIETDWCESFKKNGKTYFRIKEGVEI